MRDAEVCCKVCQKVEEGRRDPGRLRSAYLRRKAQDKLVFLYTERHPSVSLSLLKSRKARVLMCGGARCRIAVTGFWESRL